MDKKIEDLLSFIAKGPSVFHVIEETRMILDAHGFTALDEGEHWELNPGKDYYVTRNDSALIAFRIPANEWQGFHLVASHCDSPTFRIKSNPEMTVEGHYTKLNVEKYGGMISETWFDRPLSVAGRATIKTDEGVETRLVNVNRDLLEIPSLAIHMAKNQKELNIQEHLLPLLSNETKAQLFTQCIAKELGVNVEDILDTEIYLYLRTKGSVLGLTEEFILSPKLDDLACVYSSLMGFVEQPAKLNINLCAIFDNEEVGSSTKQGADSTFLPQVFERMMISLGKNAEDYHRALAKSMFISADNAHGVHPNYTMQADPTNRPYVNGGVVIKYHSGQRYTTDSVSGGRIKDLCQREGIPYQTFYNRSDMLGGSTLGNILTGQVSVSCVDLGMPQLAMHSANELGGVKDYHAMLKLMHAFYAVGEEVKGE